MLLSEDSELHLLVVQYGGSKDTTHKHHRAVTSNGSNENILHIETCSFYTGTSVEQATGRWV